jgi:integrase
MPTDAALKKPLTDAALKKLLVSPPAERHEVPDGKVAGLYLVHQPSGATSWALRYRADGASRKLTLGSFPALTLAQARRRAEEARGAIAMGKDPAGDRRAAREAAKAEKEAETDLVEVVVSQFIERYAKAHTRDWAESRRLLDRNVIARWQGRKLSQIGRADIHNLLDAIIDRGSPIAANRVFAQLRLMCSWAVKRGIIASSPCEDVSPPSSEKGRARERFLADDELRIVWGAADSLGWPFGPVVKLLMLTGARRDEVAQMRWSEVDLEARVWKLPAARAKNGRANEISLTDAALNILDGLPRFGDRDGYIFTTTNGRVPVSGFNRAKMQIDAAIAELRSAEAEARGEEPRPIEPWVFHDLRRTAASGMASLGIGPHIVEAILNHKSGTVRGVAAIYNRYTYGPEKRAALAAWATRLEAIVSGAAVSNVVELSKVRG